MMEQFNDPHWTNHLPKIMFNLNTQTSRTTSFTPYEILFSKKANTGTVKEVKDIEEVEEEIDDDNKENEDDDNKENEDDNNKENEDQEQTIEKLSKANEIRTKVNARQDKCAAKMIKQHDHRKNKTTTEFKLGDYVSVLIPRIDRGGSDLPRIPGVVHKKSGEKDFRYQVKTIYGVLDKYLRTCDLEKYNGLVETDANKNNSITLREAARLASNRAMDLSEAVVNCNCNGSCVNDGRCRCFKGNKLCNSHCHLKSKMSCSNCKNR